MIPQIKEVCDMFQKDLDNLERKCGVCYAALKGDRLMMDFDPLNGDRLGLICEDCSCIENEMMKEIIGDVTLREIGHFDPCVRMLAQQKIDAARKQVRPKLRQLKRVGVEL